MTRAARQVARRQRGALATAGLQARTFQRYSKALAEFARFCAVNYVDAPRSIDALAYRLAEFIEFLWEDGESKEVARCALAAAAHFRPHLRRRLQAHWRLITAWERCEAPRRAGPLSPLMTKATVAYALWHGWSGLASGLDHHVDAAASSR